MQPTGCVVFFLVVCALRFQCAQCLRPWTKDQKTDYVTTGGDVFHIMFKPRDWEGYSFYTILFETVTGKTSLAITSEPKSAVIGLADGSEHHRGGMGCNTPTGSAHMCSVHVRSMYNRHQVFDHGKDLREYKVKSSDDDMYGPISHVICSILMVYSPASLFLSLFPGSEHFFTSRFKIRYGKSSAMLSVGKVLLFEGFTGNGSFYYWNDKGYRANEPAILKLTDDSGSLINLELTIHWERKVVDVSEPNQFVCNSFPYTLNVNAPSLVFVVIKVFANEFEIKVNGRECAVKHRYDPNDIKLLIVEGNIEPFRYAIYEHDEEYLYDIYDIITTY